MNYIRCNIGLPLILSINKCGNIKWYIDAGFAFHKDMRSHTGGFITMVTEGVYDQPSWKKLTTKSSTDAKLVRVYDLLTQVIWNRHFLKE